DFEPEFEVRDLGFEHGGIMVGVDFVELLHALDAGRKETRVAHLGVDRVARGRNRDIAGEFHDGIMRGVERRVVGARCTPSERPCRRRGGWRRASPNTCASLRWRQSREACGGRWRWGPADGLRWNKIFAYDGCILPQKRMKFFGT